ncbi:MAG: FAD-dependent oxidoreductase [Streptosporangiales bacterium]|nr:FAD-dependent oxidoreductase [Streptosporangiales bacterium]
MTDVELRISAPVRDTVDVLVVGAGPAGLAAAIASARQGAHTLLVERYGYVGGNLTAGLVGPCMTSYSLDGSQQLIKGIFEELVLRMEAEDAAIHPSKIPGGSAYSGFISYGHERVTPFDPEAVKAIGAEMCLEAGVRLLLHTSVVRARTEDGRVTGVVVASKSGLEVLEAEVVVDCSADADVAASAGADVLKGRDEDGLTQPMTLFFRVGNVDDAAVEEYVAAHADDIRPFASLVAEATAAGEFTVPRRGVGIYKTLRSGVWRVNTTRVHRVDGTDVGDLTRAEIEGRRQVTSLMTFFRRRLPGFADCVLLDTAATIGVRETRRIRGEYTLNLDDLASGREFDDVIALCGYPVDIHSPTGSGGGVDESIVTAGAYQIPYRSLVPTRPEQLLVAGRCVSATHEALGAIRVMPPAFAMGQAAGTAAALAVNDGVAPRAVDVAELQRRLLSAGAYLGPRHETVAAGESRSGEG